MAIILCIETATTNCSVGLSVDGNIVSCKEDNGLQYSHAERLHVYIEDHLLEAQISMQQLDAIAVSKGPGSYTGLRIGVSAAKGLCFALDIPLIALPTLEILARQVKIEKGLIIPMLDARRMEVYSTIFSTSFETLRETQAQILDEASFLDSLDKETVYFIGNSNDKFQEICKHKNAIFLEYKLPSSKEMAALSEAKFKNSDFEDLAYFEPYYLKDFIGGKKKIDKV